MNIVWPFVSDVRRYERRPEFSVTGAANTADGGRVEATIQVELERGDIRRGYETEAIYATDPVAELRTEAGDLLREASGTATPRRCCRPTSTSSGPWPASYGAARGSCVTTWRALTRWASSAWNDRRPPEN